MLVVVVLVLLAVELSGMVTVIVSENGMTVMVSDGIVVGGRVVLVVIIY